MFVAAGIAAYLSALVAMLPARLLPLPGATGTVWRGDAALPGGAALRWTWSPAASLAHGALAADWTVDGPGTRLTGVASRRPAARALRDVRGRLDGRLLAALVPGLPACAVTLDIALDRIADDGAVGRVATLLGTCGGHAVPRLVATFAGADGRVTGWSDRTTTLATVALRGGGATLHLTAAGAAALPGVSTDFTTGG